MKLNTNKLIILSIITAMLLFIGCNGNINQVVADVTTSKTDSNSIKLNKKKLDKVAMAFKEGISSNLKYSKWYNRKEKLPLTIIATAYIDNKALSTPEYRAYIKLAKKIQKNQVS